MRITRELLIHSANDYGTRSVANDRSIQAIYLIGSVLTEDPLIGGATDIDLVYIHNRAPSISREIVRFTDDVSLDIFHHDQKYYEQPRSLRADPIWGPAINSTRSILFDSQHWFEYTQAIITAQFDRLDSHAARIQKLIDTSRAEWWQLEGKNTLNFKDMPIYLNAALDAINAVASISGPPLTNRRLLLNLAERCQNAGHPQLSLSFSSLLGFPSFDFTTLSDWMKIWESDLHSPVNSARLPEDIHPARQAYHVNAVKAFFENGQLESCLWILLHTWNTLVTSGNYRSPAAKNYGAFLGQLGFQMGKESEKPAALDSFIDECEETAHTWASENGA